MPCLAKPLAGHGFRFIKGQFVYELRAEMASSRNTRHRRCKTQEKYFYHKMRRQRARKQRKNIALALLALLCLGLIDILFLYIWKTDIL